MSTKDAAMLKALCEVLTKMTDSMKINLLFFTEGMATASDISHGNYN